VHPGELGALLRRKGIYSSCYYKWRRARDAGGRAALGKKRGTKARVPHPLEREVEDLKRALAKAEARVKQAEAIIEVQKKVSELLGIQLPPQKDEVS
jgi:transposase